MSRRLAIVAAVLFLIGLIAFFPLRVALSGMESQGLTARQVAGSIWYGRIGELMLKRLRLGTFEARIAPLSLLTGKAALEFTRLDDPDGPLAGTLRVGGTRGIDHGTGRLAARGLLGDVPLTDLQLDDVTLLYRDGRCDRASGRVTAVVAAPIPGLGGGFTGSPVCEGTRTRFVLKGPAGAVLEFYVNPDGRFRAWLRVNADSADVQDALATAGFRPSGNGLVLSSEGSL